MAETPMQGLAQWLREVAASPATSNAHWLDLIRWASEVEAARARPQMPKPRDFAEVAREVEAARASTDATIDDEHRAAMQRAIAAIDKRDERIEAVRLWYGEWEQIMPPDLRQAFAQSLPWAVPVEAARASLPAPTPTSQETVAMTSAAHLNRLCPCGVATLAVCAENTCAELRAAAAKTEPPMTAMDSKPVAMRYRTGQGQRWRYLNLPHTKGWTFPPNLGVPEYLYAAPPSDTALLRQCLEALEIGRDAAYEAAQLFHQAMEGYRFDDHQRADEEVAQIDAAIDAARQALEKP